MRTLNSIKSYVHGHQTRRCYDQNQKYKNSIITQSPKTTPFAVVLGKHGQVSSRGKPPPIFSDVQVTFLLTHCGCFRTIQLGQPRLIVLIKSWGSLEQSSRADTKWYPLGTMGGGLPHLSDPNNCCCLRKTNTRSSQRTFQHGEEGRF